VDTLRTFIAIELPAQVRAKISEHINRLRGEFPEVRASWNCENNLHLTLKFLGNVPVERVSALSDAAAESARSIETFDLIVSGCGWFPPRGKPNVLWIGIDDAEGNLRLLHHTLEDRCAEAGFERDARNFHPHLTIARLRGSAGIRRLAEMHKALDFPAQRFTITEIAIFRSELLQQGSKHTALSRHQLAAK